MKRHFIVIRMSCFIQGLILSSFILLDSATCLCLFPFFKMIICHCILSPPSFISPIPLISLSYCFFVSSLQPFHFLAGQGFTCLGFWIFVFVCICVYTLPICYCVWCVHRWWKQYCGSNIAERSLRVSKKRQVVSISILQKPPLYSPTVRLIVLQ